MSDGAKTGTPRTDVLAKELEESPLNIETACEHLLDHARSLETDLTEALKVAGEAIQPFLWPYTLEQLESAIEQCHELLGREEHQKQIDGHKALAALERIRNQSPT